MASILNLSRQLSGIISVLLRVKFQGDVFQDHEQLAQKGVWLIQEHTAVQRVRVGLKTSVTTSIHVRPAGRVLQRAQRLRLQLSKSQK